MKFIFTLLICLSFSHTFASSITLGNWYGKLEVKKSIFLPFRFKASEASPKTSFPTIAIFNGEEKIVLTGKATKTDSIDYVFPNFNSFIRIAVDNKNTLSGFWYNKAKGEHYKIKFSAKLIKNLIKSKENIPNTMDGKWSTVFAPNTSDKELAYGVFHQSGQALTGTFLTETGDYRYLAGHTDGNAFVLSCFDGAHAFLFTASLSKNKDSLYGKFYSGIHWESNWIAHKSAVSPLRNPDSITYIVDNKKFEFVVNDLDGLPYRYPNEDLKNKVVIVQILGTWCPNCLDESRFFKTLYDQYHKDGLEIISIAYERGRSADKRIAEIEEYKKENGFNFTYLDGGCYCDKLVYEHFNMLNAFSSYPTTFFIDRAGKVVRIHTGFAGPGTGKYYADYTKKTETLVKKLLYNR